MSTAIDIADFLSQNGYGTNAVDLFVSREPPGNTNSTTIYDTGGNLNPKWNIDQTFIQIRVKNSTYIGGFNKITEIKNYLNGINTFTINNVKYVGIYVEDEPTFLKYDDNEHAIFTINIRTQRQPLDTGNRQEV